MHDNLSNTVINQINELKSKYDCKYGELTKEEINKEVLLLSKIRNKDIKNLYKVVKNIVYKNNDEYEKCREGLSPLINDLIKLCIYYMREQDYNIKVTEQRMKNRDKASYLRDKRFRSDNVINVDIEQFEEDIPFVEEVNMSLNRIIDSTRQEYTNSFGEFESIEDAKKIIEKEYYEATTFFELFLIAKKKIYEKIDNYNPLISFLQATAYELIQLSVVLDRAIDMKRKLNIFTNNKLSCDSDFYFILMDGIDSTRTKSSKLLDKYAIDLNLGIYGNLKIKSFVPMIKILQDEIQGFILGDINEFLKLADNVFTKTKLKVVYVSVPFSKVDEFIENPEDSVYGESHVISGLLCKLAREKMTRGDYITIGGREMIENNSYINSLNRSSDNSGFVFGM